MTSSKEFAEKISELAAARDKEQTVEEEAASMFLSPACNPPAKSLTIEQSKIFFAWLDETKHKEEWDGEDIEHLLIELTRVNVGVVGTAFLMGYTASEAGIPLPDRFDPEDFDRLAVHD